MIERDFYWINPQSVVIPKGKLQEKIKDRSLTFQRNHRQQIEKKKLYENCICFSFFFAIFILITFS